MRTDHLSRVQRGEVGDRPLRPVLGEDGDLVALADAEGSQAHRGFLDGGAHFYGVYECSCGNFISIGSIEPQFYALLRKHADLTDADFDAQMDRKASAAAGGGKS